MNDHELIDTLKTPATPAAFRAALGELYHRYAERLRRVAARYCRDAADDIVHDAWLKIADKIKQFDTGTNFPAWAAKVTATTALDLLKKHRPAGLPENYDPPVKAGPAPMELSETAEQRRAALESCKTGLTDKERIVIERRLSGDSTTEIAAIISLSIERVYSLWTEGTKKLRSCVERKLAA